jgi:hypothetical protein
MIRRDHVVAVGERWNQIPEHVGAGRESVQEDHCRRVGVARFTVEQPMTIDCRVTVMNSRHDVPPEAMFDSQSSAIGAFDERWRKPTLKFWVI